MNEDSSGKCLPTSGFWPDERLNLGLIFFLNQVGGAEFDFWPGGFWRTNPEDNYNLQPEENVIGQ